MNLKKLILTENNCYKAGKPLTIKGIMVHSTGANNPTLKRYVNPDDGFLGVNKNNNHWNKETPDGRQVCVHAFIGKLEDGSIATYQTLPWNMRGWHGGSGAKGSVNDTHIGFEICEDGHTDSRYFNAVYKEAVELCAYLCAAYKLNPLADGVLICHSEGYKRGVASNHGDVMHWFPKFGKSMDTFRADVRAVMDNGVNVGSGGGAAATGASDNDGGCNEMVKRYNTLDEIPAWGKPTIEKLVSKGYLNGNGQGLNLTEDMLRIFVVLDRAVGYDAVNG